VLKETEYSSDPLTREERTRAVTLELLDYCRARDWAGYDPYDALNSRVFRALPFLNFGLARLALTQGVKRSPVNLRPLLLVPKTPNPKGLALFLSSLVRLTKARIVEGEADIEALASKLMALRSPGRSRPCWGYSFAWQQRAALVPQWSPNIICTTFAANALLDAHELEPEPVRLETALGAGRFILEDFLSRDEHGNVCFRYTLVGRDRVHNANLLGAAFLCRLARISGQPGFLEPALEAARYSVSRQHADGSWAYGEAANQGWIDNFHTGFDLVALRRIGAYAETGEFEPALRKGFEFFKTHFFEADGAPRYYHDSLYPIDIHSAAQSIITLREFADEEDGAIDLAYKVLGWARAHLRSRCGYFYFQKRRRLTVRTPFMRWSQAWMLMALATLLSNGRPDGIGHP
jgi:hypothetical protein